MGPAICGAAVPVAMITAVDNISIDDFMLMVDDLGGKEAQVNRRGAGYRPRHQLRHVWIRPEYHARSNP